MSPGPGPPVGASVQGRSGAATSMSSSNASAVPKSPAANMLVDEEAAQKAARDVQEFLNQREGSALKAWLRHFDVNNDQKISLNEFMRGMRKMNFPGDVTTLSLLDSDRSGELSLEEIDMQQAVVWRRFRTWCVASFEGVQDMLEQLRGHPLPRNRPPDAEEHLSPEQFTEGLRRAGWDGGFEGILVSALDVDNRNGIEPHHLKWLEIEKWRQRRKEQAKRRSLVEVKARAQNWKASAAIMADFKQFLKRKYGHYVRAWRSALSPDGSMVLQKSDLFKACSSIGWQGDVRLLYKAFDKDDSGYISIEELDPRSAELLAHFRVFIDQRFGGAVEAFRALDKFNTKKLRQPEFVNAVKSYGFQFPAKLLFHGIDLDGCKSIVEEDMLFLDKWRPPAYLVAPPNQQAAEEVKMLLLKTFKNYLKAWRQILDPDSSNRCNYDEFEAACKRIGFRGDVPGAWRALDDDLSGFITLHEIDPVSCETLQVFRRWCDDEFGSVRSAFGVFDMSGDNEVTYREFRRSCRIYGFEGNVHTLFHALDAERNGTLSIEEVTFLDDWEFQDGQAQDQTQLGPQTTQDLPPSQRAVVDTIGYETNGPGPAKYAPPTTIGAGPVTPMVHFSGAYSFRKRPQGQRLPGLPRGAHEQPSPTSYDDRLGICATTPSKPSWAFGTEPRRVIEPVLPESKQPGPGQYSPTRRRGTAVTCTPRRPLKVHPMLREGTGSGGAWSARAALPVATPRLPRR